MKPHLAFFLSIALATAAHATDWYVAKDGNDQWSGKLAAPNAGTTDGPFQSLKQAQNAVRAAIIGGDTSPKTVQIREGVHELAQGLVFDARDTGTADAPVVWRAYENEKPILIGGRQVHDWTEWKDGIYQTDVAPQGFKGKSFKQFFFAGQRQILARYPNYDPQHPYSGGWAYVDGEMWPMYADKEGEDRHTLLVKSQDWREWKRPQDVEVFVFPRYNWWNDILRVKSVDAEKHTVTTAKDGSYAMRANDRYYFQGALEDLDAPGEWYLDKEAWRLYFKPPAPLDSAPAYAPTVRDIIKVENANYFTLRGLMLECADGSAVVLSKCNHCRIVACTVRNVGDFSGTGLVIHDGTDNGIVGCDISQTGSSGVSLSGGDIPTLTPANNFVDNCYIHHVGVFYKQGVGVALQGVGQRVSHCLIHDTPRFAIQFTGNKHILEYNHLRHIALETEDVGATYCGGRDWISPRGTVIRYNFIHDVLGFGWNGKWTSPYFAWGIYLDDNSGGVDVIGNIVARCGRSCLHGHSARDCRVENNVFVEGGMRQWEFNGWTVKQRFWESTLPQMIKGYESVAHLPAWKDMRGMDVPPEKIPDSEGRVMSGDVFTRNIIAWKNPDAKALNVVNFNPERNHFDDNLYWHYGQPIKTGQRKAGKVISGNLAPNAEFKDGGTKVLPEQWQWQIHTPGGKAGVVDENGQHVLKIDAAFNHEKKRDNYPIVVSHEVELKPGVAYRLQAKLRTDEADGKASLMVQFYLPPKNGQPGHFWASSPANAKVTKDWQDFDFAFSIPAKGEKGWHEAMKNFRIRLDWPEENGSLYAKEIVLEETESLNEWQSWQALGDQHSVIADPKFLDAGKDDYRLAPDSPAWKLGFKPIPVEKMGPYASPDRATWPIVEAEGAREHPDSQ